MFSILSQAEDVKHIKSCVLILGRSIDADNVLFISELNNFISCIDFTGEKWKTFTKFWVKKEIS